MKFKVRKERKKGIYMKLVNLLATKLSIRKEKAEKIYLQTLYQIKKDQKLLPLKVISSCIEILEPPLKTKKKKIAGQVYPLPSFLHKEGRSYFAINYLIEAMKSVRNHEINITDSLTKELLDIHSKNSIALKYKEELIQKLEENRPFMRLPKKRYTWRRKRKLRIPKYRALDRRDTLLTPAVLKQIKEKNAQFRQQAEKTLHLSKKPKWQIKRKNSSSIPRRGKKKKISFY